MSRAAQALTLKQFLRLRETKPPREFINGQVVQKVSPKAKRSVLQGEFCFRIREIVASTKRGMALPELRCTFAGRSLVFDVAYFQRSHIAFEENGEPVDDVTDPPDWIVEILSAGQTIRNMTQRSTWCVKNGVSLAWLVARRLETVTVFQAGCEPRVCRGNEPLDATVVLPGFSTTPNAVFGWLRL